jgi:hypothetical protein
LHLEVGDRDFYLDLLFYHLKMRCYVVIDLKAREFTPEAAGKMNFYLSAVDDPRTLTSETGLSSSPPRVVCGAWLDHSVGVGGNLRRDRHVAARAPQSRRDELHESHFRRGIGDSCNSSLRERNRRVLADAGHR